MNEYQIISNPDFVTRKKIEEAIKENEGYCCCSLFKDEDTKCICKDFREQQTSGFCHCGRYYKILNTKTGYLCGKTKFKHTFLEKIQELTLKGYIIINSLVEDEEITENQKAFVRELEKAKIAQSDILFVYGTYDDAKEQIEWAKELNKEISFV